MAETKVARIVYTTYSTLFNQESLQLYSYWKFQIFIHLFVSFLQSWKIMLFVFSTGRIAAFQCMPRNSMLHGWAMTTDIIWLL